MNNKSNLVENLSTNEGHSLSLHDEVIMLEKLSPWLTAIGRILLGLVLAWFGYHELVVPKLWTGYVPVLSPSSQISEVLVLFHGIVLSILAVGLIFGIMPRTMALLASLAMLEIVVTLILTAGFSDLVLRDIGVMGLALIVAANSHQKLVLRS
ncbi:MAG: hypothetical protein M1288_04360 [Actinobacteria bacterium]|nr:hypothetical protein [Actinomycetota bacterium]